MTQHSSIDAAKLDLGTSHGSYIANGPFKVASVYVIKLFTKYFRTRIVLIVAPVMVAIMGIILVRVAREFSLAWDDMIVYRGTVQSVTQTKCFHEGHRKGFYADCIEVVTVEKQFMVRLDASESKNYWPTVLASTSQGAAIEAKVSPLRNQTFALHNPSYLRIDDRVVIPFDHSKGVQVAIIALTALMMVGFTYLFYLAYKAKGQSKTAMRF